MPSDDPGNKGGFIRSHRFAAANTAVSTANLDSVQVAAVRAFLQALNGILHGRMRPVRSTSFVMPMKGILVLSWTVQF